MAKKMNIMSWVVLVVGVLFLLRDLKIAPGVTYGIDILTAAFVLYGIQMVTKK